MAEKKTPSPSKNELLRVGYDENSEVGEEREDITYNSFYSRVHNRYFHRFPIICIVNCLSCFIFSLISLGVCGVILRIRLNQTDSNGAIASSTLNTFQIHHGIWVEETPDDYPCGEYLTPEMLHVIDPEDMPYHEGPFWTTRDYHTSHCSYAWMKMHRAVE